MTILDQAKRDSTAVDDTRQQLDISTVPIEPSEDGLARAFAERYADRLRFDHTRGKWYQWDRARWKEENTQLAFHWARELCREVNKKADDRALPKVRTASAVETFCRADRRLAVTHEIWDRDPWLLCTPAGTVDLRSGSLRPNDPADHQTRCTAVSPDDAPAPLFRGFLEETTRGDGELQAFLQRLAGYALTGVTREHALFFLYGLGGNGKGTFVNAVAEAMGDYAVTAAMDTFHASKHDRHPAEIAALNGARLVTASETEEGRAWAESRIKQLTGGDPISARFMRRDFFTFKPQFKLVVQGNHKPVLRNVDDAARRRFHIVPFVNKPANPDPELPERLRAEYPAILHWAIQGCLDWQKCGLAPPQAVQRETEEYFSDQDSFAQWLEECTERKYETTGETTALLYASWKSWATRQGEDAGTERSLGEKLAAAGYRKVKHTPGHRNKRGFVGIALRVNADERLPYAD